MDQIKHRLVCYGSLQPGQENHHVLGPAGKGIWQDCKVRARMGFIGPYMGSPGPYKIVTLDDTADFLNMQLLTSAHLEALWPLIDDFEGYAYKRVSCVAQTGEGPVSAYIYVASGQLLKS